MSDQRPKQHLTGHQLRHLGEFMTALNELAREHGVDVCPYGAITIEVSGFDNEMRLNLAREDGSYVIKELS